MISSDLLKSLDLPILALLPECRRVFSENLPLLLTAEPGAGKTTVLPLAMLDEPWLKGQKLLVLEPRRLAVYAGASRLAKLLGELVGQTVGWRTGEETRAGPRTRIEVMTEGVLLRLLAEDADLPGVGAVLFDEFHERTLPADEGLAFCVDVRRNLRPDLRLGLLSATLDVRAARGVLPDAVEVHSPGRAFPVQTTYRPGREGEPWIETAARAVEDGWEAVSGGILVFLPGWGEIQAVKGLLEDKAQRREETLAVLHGTLANSQQSALFEPSPRRRTVLASAVAQTSLTLPDVSLVIDAGWSRFVRFDARNDLDRLVTERESQADADQRRGRAGRTGPGLCWRLWPLRETLEPFPQPEILRADLGGVVLDAVLWGSGGPGQLTWIDEPPLAGWNAALGLLERLEAVDLQHKPTHLGREMGRLGLPPRLAHLLLKGRQIGSGVTAARIAAVLQNRDDSVRDADFRRRLEGTNPGIEKSFQTFLNRLEVKKGAVETSKVGLLLAWAYPEKVALRQWGPEAGPQGPVSQYQTAGGRSLRVTGDLARERCLAVAEADAGSGVGKIFSAAPLSEADLAKIAENGALASFEAEDILGNPRLFRTRRLGALVLEKTGVALKESPSTVRKAWLDAVRAQEGLTALPWTEESRLWLARVRFWAKARGGPPWQRWTVETLRDELELWAEPHLNWDNGKLFPESCLMDALAERLGWDWSQRLDSAVPRWIVLPSGGRRKLDYPEEGGCCLHVKLTEVLGWKDTPL
ncbi:MAG: ATP-dependent helicase HrpB, partial [Spirochaetales bacterium]|nr:ATP-dependent helicase HrpB [Spirochaetales bacterium]